VRPDWATLAAGAAPNYIMYRFRSHGTSVAEFIGQGGGRLGARIWLLALSNRETRPSRANKGPDVDVLSGACRMGRRGFIVVWHSNVVVFCNCPGTHRRH